LQTIAQPLAGVVVDDDNAQISHRFYSSTFQMDGQTFVARSEIPENRRLTRADYSGKILNRTSVLNGWETQNDVQAAQEKEFGSLVRSRESRSRNATGRFRWQILGGRVHRARHGSDQPSDIESDQLACRRARDGCGVSGVGGVSEKKRMKAERFARGIRIFCLQPLR
jgi:hypothetical protein